MAHLWRASTGALVAMITFAAAVVAAGSAQLRGGVESSALGRDAVGGIVGACASAYNPDVDVLYREEVEPRFVAEGDGAGTQTFLDSTAAQLYLNQQVLRVAELLMDGVYGNPHSASPSSERTARVTAGIKAQLLELFSARADEWELVFTRSATGALRMIGEALPWSQASALVLLRNNHNSVLGIREDACVANARLGTTDADELESWLSEVEGAVAQGNLLKASRLGTQGPLGRDWASGEGAVRPSMCKGPSVHECSDAGSKVHQVPTLHALVNAPEAAAHQGPQAEPEEDRECKEGQVGQVMTHQYSLFAYPAADNVNGQLFPLSWVDRLHRIPQSPDRRPPPHTADLLLTPGDSIASNTSVGAGAGASGRRSVACTGTRHHWLVLLDTAAFVPHHPLNLTEVQPDFAVMSFYKMFGFPTGVGAMLVRKEVARLLWPRYWAGGSIFTATASLRWQCFHDPPMRLELGTPAFLEILALKAGLETLRRLGGVRRVHAHTQCVAAHLAERLLALKHSNGAPMVRLFGRWEEELGRWARLHEHQQLRRAERPGPKESVQGPTANFIMLDPSGQAISHKVVAVEAAEAGIHVRAGCMCGPGQCYHQLGITDAEIQAYARMLASSTEDESWEEEAWEFIQVNRTGEDGVERPVRLPLGTVRASLGWVSRWQDANVLVQFLQAMYRDVPAEEAHLRHRLKCKAQAPLRQREAPFCSGG